MSQYLNVHGVKLLQAGLGPVRVVLQKGRLVVNEDVDLHSLRGGALNYLIEPVFLVLLVNRSDHLKLWGDPPPCDEDLLFRPEHSKCCLAKVVLSVNIKL